MFNFAQHRRIEHYQRGIAKRRTHSSWLQYAPTHVPWMPIYDHLSGFHNHLCMCRRAPTKTAPGLRCNCRLTVRNLPHCRPSGEIVALATTNGDEVFTAIIADAHTDIPAECAPHRKPEIARLEVTLFKML